MDRYLSGIKPTGRLTLGNYIGAIKQFKEIQDKGELFLFVADLHALTMPIDPKELYENTHDIVAFYLASGIDPKKTTIFLQSDVHEHSELAIILQNYLYMGELSRMTQYKDKTQKMNNEAIGLGIFAYPVLMAGDIVLYDADYVPVGDDQVQHVELTRTLVNRFNNRYGDVLILPKTIKRTNGARIMSLANPDKKMSKSDPKGNISLDEDLKSIEKKVMSAVTDMGNEIKYDEENKPGISNLISIYSVLTNKTIKEVEEEFKDCTRYGEFKKAVAKVVVEEIGALQERYNAIKNSGIIDEILEEGREKASKVASVTLKRVQEAVGIYRKW